jgi:glycosyltransferase involved in cell wall biosynthesis
MRGLDIVVHASSKPEPFGRVIAEAQACGRAVVAVGTGGSGEVFEDGVTGLAIRANDAADLADVLERLLRNEALRQSLAAAGPNYVKARFDRRDLAAAWNDIYDTTTARQ